MLNSLCRALLLGVAVAKMVRSRPEWDIQASACHLCTAGSYQAEPGAKGCTACPAGARGRSARAPSGGRPIPSCFCAGPQTKRASG